MRRLGRRLGVVLAVAMTVGGVVVGYLGYRADDGPAGAVRGYFAALQAGDAPRALAWGDVPDGPHALLTSQVLRVQRRIAPIRDLRLGRVERDGTTATVAVSYDLAFPGADLPARSTIGLVRRGGDWRLRATAVATQILLQDGSDRASVLGARVPADETLLFPGALPITFDSPYLELDPTEDSVAFGGSPVVEAVTELSDSGRDAVQSAVTTALLRCLGARAEVTCPVPSSRYVPGTVRGTFPRDALDELTIVLGSGDDPQIRISGHVPVTGSYRKLTFANRAVTGRGTVDLLVNARAGTATPLVVHWTST